MNLKTFAIKQFSTLLGRRISCRLGRSLYMTARHESQNNMIINGEQLIQNNIKKLCTKDEKLVIFDVGANIGDWTIYLLDDLLHINRITNIEIHAFEPVNSTFKVLKKNILNHQLGSCVNFNNLALSSENGIDKIYVSGENAGTNSLHRDGLNQNQQTLSIQKSTAADYCTKLDIKKIHFLKIDTEGHDVEVLKGALPLFKEQKILVCQFEYNFRWVYSQHFLKEVFDLLNDLPYKIGKITNSKIQFYNKWHPELERFFEGNYIIMHNNSISSFNHEIGDFDSYYVFTPEKIK